MKKLARRKINLSKKELEKEIAKRLINPYYLSQRYEPQYKVKIDQDLLNLINSKITIKSNYNLLVELYDLKNIFKEMSTINARFINQCQFEHQVVFSAIFDREIMKKLNSVLV